MATPPTDAELDVFIRARLASQGIDLDQLPAGSASDPTTGSPGRDAVLTSLRRFIRTSVADISAYLPPSPEGASGPQALLQQQTAVPFMYPAGASAWRQA